MSAAKGKLLAAIDAAKRDDYLRAFTLFLEIYGEDEQPQIKNATMASGLSWFGLCLAFVQKKYKPAIDLAKRAIELEFYNGDHYANLTRIYIAAGNRKKALETAKTGLGLLPEHDLLLAARDEVGVRERPPVPFLDRKNPINVSLGQARHARKIADKEKPKR